MGSKREGIVLAVPADEGKIERLNPHFFYEQPKLNGERGRTEDFEGHPVVVSSHKNSFEFLDKIKGEIARYWEGFGMNAPFDGEIYKHGWSRERIDSALRRSVNYNPDVEQLEYHVFDLNLPIIQSQRLLLLDMIFEKVGFSEVIHKVPTYKAHAKNWMTIADVFVNQGFEGAILRNPDYPCYDPRRLVGQMLKYKPSEIDEYIIKGVNEAFSKEGQPKGIVGSFTVQGDDGILFNVGAGKLTHVQRFEYWVIRKSLEGKTLVTKQGKILTSEGIPTCTVAVEIKETK